MGSLLWYDRPAEKWTDALPLGNGTLGGMVFGTVECERVGLNESTLWSGKPNDGSNSEALKALPEVRNLLFAEKYHEANELAREKMLGTDDESFLPLGNLLLRFFNSHIYTGYRRALDMSTGIHNVEFKVGETTFKRETLISHPARVMVVRLEADQPGRIYTHATLDSAMPFRLSAEGDSFMMQGRACCSKGPESCRRDGAWEIPPYSDDAGMGFASMISATSEGGKVTLAPDGLRIEGADAATIYLCAATSYNGFDRDPATDGIDEKARAKEMLKNAMTQNYETIKKEHIDDHGALYNRVSFEINSDKQEDITTDRRIRFRGASDTDLIEMVFNYGRYLMIAGSRKGGQATNLQGLWNDLTRPSWCSNYTININTEMNYWPAEVCNLHECHEPLFDLLKKLSKRGEQVAKINYGCRGWVSHHNTDLWAHAHPVAGSPFYALWPMSGGWFCRHLWEGYEFNGNIDFLKDTAYPIMRGAALFMLDWLVENPEGQLTTAPSTSPENCFLDVNGTSCGICAGSAMDRSIIKELFGNCIKASQILGLDEDLSGQMQEALKRLKPHGIGSRGEVLEWHKEFKENEPHHRHVSHLYGLYPANEFTEEKAPELFAASKRSLELRGDEATGWSMGWKVNLWARLRDGDHACVMLERLLRPAESQEPAGEERSGVYANLFDAHPPFQIDGNYGVTAGIAEMLLQSHEERLELLPALPSAWKSGKITGLRARGGYEVSIAWDNGKLTEATITSYSTQPCRIKYAGRETTFDIKAGDPITLDGKLSLK